MRADGYEMHVATVKNLNISCEFGHKIAVHIWTLRLLMSFHPSFHSQANILHFPIHIHLSIHRRGPHSCMINLLLMQKACTAQRWCPLRNDATDSFWGGTIKCSSEEKMWKGEEVCVFGWTKPRSHSSYHVFLGGKTPHEKLQLLAFIYFYTFSNVQHCKIIILGQIRIIF